MTRRTRLAIDVLLLLVVVFAGYRVYRWSPGAVQDCDSNYSMAAGEMLVRNGTLRLDAALPDDLSTLPCYAPPLGKPYQLIELPADEVGRGGYYYGYPLGSVVFSLPLIHYYSTTRGISSFGPDGLFSAQGERRLQEKLAALVAAGCVGVFFLIGRALLPGWAAALVALGFAFGSMAWSTLSRGMWSHTWLTVELGLVIWLLCLLTKQCSAGRDSTSNDERIT